MKVCGGGGVKWFGPPRPWGRGKGSPSRSSFLGDPWEGQAVAKRQGHWAFLGPWDGTQAFSASLSGHKISKKMFSRKFRKYRSTQRPKQKTLVMLRAA